MKSFPVGLSPELTNFCSQFNNDIDVVNNLAKNPSNLIQFYKACVGENEVWRKNHADLNQKIIQKISELCSQTGEQYQKNIEDICGIMLRNLIKNTSASEDLDDIFDVLKLAIANSSNRVINECIARLKIVGIEIQIVENGFNLILGDLSNYFKGPVHRIIYNRLVNQLIHFIGKFIDAYKDKGSIEIELLPISWNYPSLINFTNKYGQYVNKMFLFDRSIDNDTLDKIFNNLSNLKDLNLTLKNITHYEFLKNLPNLTHLNLTNESDQIKEIPELRYLLNLKTLKLIHFSNLTSIPELKTLKNLTELNVSECGNLVELTEIENLENLTYLFLHNLNNFKEFPKFDLLVNLKALNVLFCPIINFSECTKLCNLTSLKITGAKMEIADLTPLAKLEDIVLNSCTNLKEIKLDNLTNLNNFRLNCSTKLESFSAMNVPNLHSIDLISNSLSLKKVALDINKFTDLKKIFGKFYKFLNKLPQTLLMGKREIGLKDNLRSLFIELADETNTNIPIEFISSEEKLVHLNRMCLLFDTIIDHAKQSLNKPAINQEQLNTIKKIFEEFDLQQYQKHLLWFSTLILEIIADSDLTDILTDKEALLALQGIAKLSDPYVINTATNTLFNIYRQKDPEQFQTWNAASNVKHHLSLVKMAMVANGVSTQELNRVLQLLASGTFKNAEILNPIIEFLLLLSKTTLDLKRKNEIIKMVFESPQKGKNSKETQKILEQSRARLEQNVNAGRDILFFNQKDKLDKSTNSDDWVNIRLEIFKEIFNIKGEKHEVQNFMEIFRSKARQPGALITYSARLQTLPDKKRYTELLGKFMMGVLKNEYPEIRYQFEDNAHLEKIFGERPELLAKWKASIRFPATEVLGKGKAREAAIVPSEVFGKHLETAIRDNHFGIDQARRFHVLDSFTEWNNKEAIEKTKELLEKQLSDLIAKLKSTKDAQLKQQIQEQKNDLEVQITCFRALNSDLTEDQLIEFLNRLRRILPDCEFKNTDVDGIIKKVKTEILPHDRWSVKDSDFWEDLLLLGTEVLNSCQKIDGNVDLNKCLLAYILDGKIKPMLVVDADGTILARSVMRVKWDEQLEQPVLFMERLYTRNADPALEKLVLEGCIRKAKEMGLTLVASEADYQQFKDNPVYENALSSLGGPAPAEYVDALGGIQENGVYTIPKSRVVYSPEVHTTLR